MGPPTHLCCLYAVCTLMFEAPPHAEVDPDRVSFTAALRITRRSLSQARDFPPQATDHGRLERAVVLLCRRLNALRRLRSKPRVVKGKMPNAQVAR